MLAFDDVPPTGSNLRPATLEGSEHIANRPIAHHVLDGLESSGVSEVVVVSSVGRAREVRKCLSTRDTGDGAPLRYVERRAPVDVVTALNLAAPIVGESRCILHSANGLLDQPLVPFTDLLEDGSPDVVLIVHPCRDHCESFTIDSQAMLPIRPLDPSGDALGLAGVWLFGAGAFGLVSGAVRRVGGELDLTMAASRVRAAGGRFHVRIVDAWTRYAGDPVDLLELNRMALDRLEMAPRRLTIRGSRIEGRVWIHEEASIAASVIIGPAVIGAGAQIADAYVGPYTSVGPRARIEGAEIEISIVSTGASIMHVGSRMVASVVGRDARIFRDFSLPRAFRLRIGEGTEIALC